MKHLLLITLLFLFNSCASQKAQSKFDTVSFKVEGVCKMCKERIESTLDVVGVSSANWELETSLLTVVFNPKKIKEDDLHQLLSNAGHRTEKMEKNAKAYNNLPNCCKYDDGINKH